MRAFLYHFGTRVVLALFLSIIVLLMVTSATTLCFACYGIFKHRAALWLSMCMTGLTWFAVALLLLQMADTMDGPSIPWPPGVKLLCQALGAILVAHSLPRFLLSAFGTTPSSINYRLLDAATVIVAALSALRVVTGWKEESAVASLPAGILRILVIVIVGGSLGLTLIFQSRLPDRNLYKTVILQIGALALLFPFIVLEDYGLFTLSGFPYLGGHLLIVSMSMSGTLHARQSLMRPKYVVNDAPSSYFVEQFGISGRELEVVSGVLHGLSNNEIAERLFISARTVEKHLYNIYQKARIRNRLQLFNLLRSDAR